MAATTTPAIDRLAAVLAEADRPLTQAELALAAGVGRSTATTLLTRLTAKDVRRIDNGPKASSTYATLALLDTLAEAAAQEDAEVMGAEAAAAMDEPELTAAELAAGPDSDTRHREAMSASGVPVAVLPHGGAAIPTADMMRNGLIRGTWKQLGAVLGDTVEVLTPNQERLVGELATSGGVCFLVVEGGRQVSLGGWATKQYARLVRSARSTERPGPVTEAKAKKAAAKKAAAPAPAEGEKADGRKGDRSHYVPRGGLKAMVWAWYAANPGVAMTPHKMAKAIGAKAPGAVLDQQRNAVKAGYAVEHLAPLRFEWLAGVECPEEQATMAASLGFVPERLES